MGYYGKNAKKKRDMTTCEHVSSCVCYSPCIAWSVLFRFLCCPIACMRHGPVGCCSDNECTSCTDLFLFDVIEGKTADHTDTNGDNTKNGICVPKSSKIKPL